MWCRAWMGAPKAVNIQPPMEALPPLSALCLLAHWWDSSWVQPDWGLRGYLWVEVGADLVKMKPEEEDMSSYLELEGNRFWRGWGAVSFSGPPGMDVKKRRKPATHGDGVSTTRGPQVPELAPPVSRAPWSEGIAPV